MSDYKFETLQLHVEQENPDPATDARAVIIPLFPLPIRATTESHLSRRQARRLL